mgnify:CR=1 FL=1
MNHTSWNLQNTYLKLPSKLYSKQLPVPVKNPSIIKLNKSLANELGLRFLLEEEKNIAVNVLSGNNIPTDTQPLALAYAGHQFGYFTMLGDGRAVLLGEINNNENQKFDIQLKGSGPTPYSRNGDGRATLSSMLREYIISESIYHLGIPTSRSLQL